MPNGTFRELQYDEQLHGAEGEMVKVAKGTSVRIPVWHLHMNPVSLLPLRVFSRGGARRAAARFARAGAVGLATLALFERVPVK